VLRGAKPTSLSPPASSSSCRRRKHGFANNGTTTLRIQSTLAEPVFEAAYDGKRETPPGASGMSAVT